MVTVAKKVRDNGKAFEDVLRQREKDNPRFAFLQDEEVSLERRHWMGHALTPDLARPSRSDQASITSACSSIRTTNRLSWLRSRTKSVVVSVCDSPAEC